MMQEHNLTIRVYAEDLDSFGIVHHSIYVKYMERARTDWLLAKGHALDKLAEEGIILPVRSIQLEYLKPARFNDDLNIVTKIKKLGRASITFQQHIYYTNVGSQQLDFQQDAARTLLCHAEVKVACVNRDLRPYPLPEFLMEAICGHY